ncbi:MAG TPA: helix-turn-helix domain-containing protein [Pirellulales bacterium]
MAKKRSNRLSDQVRQAIDDSGRSRYELSRAAKIDESALAKFYNARRTLSMPALDRLGEVLGLEIVMRQKPRKKDG